MIKKCLELLSIFTLSVILFSCSESPVKKNQTIAIDSIIYKPGTKEPFTGTWKGEMDSIKIVFDVVNGKKEGRYTSYYPNGKVLMTGEIKNNRNAGEWKYFYDNGILESSGIFENDLPKGKWSWYYQDGTIRETGYFKDGKRDSIWKAYDYDGKLIDSVLANQDTTKIDTSF